MTLTMENGDTVTVSGLQDKYINGASLANNTLTITRNDGTNFTVDNIATMDDISGQVGNVLNFAWSTTLRLRLRRKITAPSTLLVGLPATTCPITTSAL